MSAEVIVAIAICFLTLSHFIAFCIGRNTGIKASTEAFKKAIYGKLEEK